MVLGSETPIYERPQIFIHHRGLSNETKVSGIKKSGVLDKEPFPLGRGHLILLKLPSVPSVIILERSFRIKNGFRTNQRKQ